MSKNERHSPVLDRVTAKVERVAGEALHDPTYVAEAKLHEQRADATEAEDRAEDIKQDITPEDHRTTTSQAKQS